MRGVYRASIKITGVTTAKTLLYITTPSTAVIEILSARVTDTNEDTSEQIQAELNRISSLGTPTGTSVTPKPTEEGSAASGVTCKGNITVSEPTYDSAGDEIANHGANKLGGWEYVPLPEERIIVKPSDSVGLRLIDAIANSSTIVAEITFREIG